ncbi:BrnT family toxin [Bradyrhizobium sp. TM233]|uniref:BrnT family toxin n=1 Tax=Bradyrhizobium sp. TM233 TaxID=2599801 RepID=UPI00403D6DD0
MGAPSRRRGAFSAIRWPCRYSTMSLAKGEERWVTMGRSPAGNLLLVVHTYVELTADRAAIRIISGRYPSRREIGSYEG